MGLPALLCALAPQFIPPPLDPATHVSPSGALELRVEPADRRGHGAAHYRMSRAGRELWTAELPYALWDAAVLDDGSTVGLARAANEFIVLSIDDAGALRFAEPFAHETWILHGPALPMARGVVAQPERQRVWVRVWVEPEHGPSWYEEQWWPFDMRTGVRGPARTIASERGWSIADAHAVTGVDPILAREELNASHVAATFRLIDGSGRTVWELPPAGSDPDLLERGQHVEHLPASGVGRFDLGFVGARERVRYEIRPDPEADAGWRVAELGRTPYEPDAPPPPPPTTSLELAPAGVVELDSPHVDRGPIRDVRAWTIDERRGFHFVRRDGVDAFTFVDVDRTGRVTRERSLEPWPAAEETSRTWAFAGDSRWLVAARGWQDGDVQHIRYADVASGRLVELPELPRLDDLCFDELACDPDGGFVALVSLDDGAVQEALLAFDERGAARWRLDGGPPDDLERLFAADDVAVTTSGAVVVLEGVPKRLRVVDPEGRVVRTIELADAWPSPPGYLSEIVAGPSDTVLVPDGERLVQMDVEGRVVWSAEPRSLDDRRPDWSTEAPRWDARGAWWSCDGLAFHRLDLGGRVVERVGAEPPIGVLTNPGASRILPDGRIAIQDLDSGALHVWSDEGRKLFVGRPLPEDRDEASSIGRVTSAPDGSIWVAREGGRRVGWDAHGRRLGTEDRVWIAFGPAERSWTWGRSEGPRCFDARGDELVRIDHRADDRWFRRVRDVAFAGEHVAVLDTRFGRASSDPAGPLVSIHELDGEPIDGLPLPAAFGDARELHVTQDWLLVASLATRALLIARATHAAHAIDVVPSQPGERCRFGLSADGERLLALEPHSLVLRAFELPD